MTNSPMSKTFDKKIFYLPVFPSHKHFELRAVFTRDK